MRQTSTQDSTSFQNDSCVYLFPGFQFSEKDNGTNTMYTCRFLYRMQHVAHQILSCMAQIITQSSSYTYSSRVRLLYFFFIFGPISNRADRWEPCYYQCSNLTIIVRQHDQGASNNYKIYYYLYHEGSGIWHIYHERNSYRPRGI